MPTAALAEITRNDTTGINPLIVVKSNDQIDAESAAKKDASQAAQYKQSEQLTTLAGMVKAGWEDAQKYRSESGIDDLLLENLRQSNNEYEPDIAALLSDRGQSTVFLGLTAKKQRDAQAWLLDVTRPERGAPFKLLPTPDPSLSADVEQAVVAKVMSDYQQYMQMGGEPVGQNVIYQYAAMLRDEVDYDIDNEAKDRAGRMQKAITDKLEEGGFIDAWMQFVQHMVMFPTAFLKGPILRKRTVLTWKRTAFGMQPVREKQLVHTWEAPSPLDIYPARETTTVQDGTFYERIKLSPASLVDMKGLDGFDDDAIDKILANHRPGVFRELTTTDSDRKELEDKGSNNVQPADYIEGVEMYGQFTGNIILEHGIKNDLEGEPIQPFFAYDVNCIMVGGELIYASLNTNLSGERPYSATSWEKRSGSFWGRSLPTIMKDLQAMVNSTARSLQDNESICSGPQAVYNDVGRIPAGEDITSLYPFKIHQFTNPNPSNAAPPLSFLQPDSNAMELMTVYDKLATMVDEYTGIPAYVSGSTNVKGAGRTSSGLAMLMGNSARGIKRVLLNVDIEIYRTIVKREYDWHMLFADDDEIKGDVQIVCSGVLAEIVRSETNQARLSYLQSTANPIDAQIIGPKGRAALHREIVQSLEMPVDEIIPSEEELERKATAAVAAAQSQGQMPPMMGGEQEAGNE
jgi:hypothetical protein